MTPESGPSIPTQEEVIDLFKKYGKEDHYAVERYDAWLADLQQRIDESRTNYPALMLNIMLAETLYRAGIAYDARIYLQDAWSIFYSESVRYDSCNLPEELAELLYKLNSLDNM